MQTVLLIVLSTGILGIAVTLWLVLRSPAPANTGEDGEPDQPQEREPEAGQPEQARHKLLAAPSSTGLALSVSVPAPQAEPESPNVGLLLHKAHAQLKARQQGIESELVRIDALRREQEAVSAQVKALDAVMAVFALSQGADPRPNDQPRFAPRANVASVGASMGASAAAVRE
jgi:hypothetical protein